MEAQDLLKIYEKGWTLPEDFQAVSIGVPKNGQYHIDPDTGKARIAGDKEFTFSVRILLEPVMFSFERRLVYTGSKKWLEECKLNRGVKESYIFIGQNNTPQSITETLISEIKEKT